MLSYVFLYIILSRNAFGSDLMITFNVHLSKKIET